MNRKRLPIFLELIISSIIIIVAVLCIYTVGEIISFNDFSEDYQEDQLKDRYDELKYLLNNTNADLDKILKEDEYIRIYRDSSILYQTNDDIWQDVSSDEVKIKSIDSMFIKFKKYILLEKEIKINGNEYIIQIVQKEEILNEFLENYFSVLVVISFIGIILSIVGAILLSRSFITRLKMLTNTMIRVKEEGIKARVEISEAHDEFDDVSLMFNSMMDEVEEAFNEQSRFVSDASHELKTPLTALKGHLSMIKRWGKNDKERLEKSIDICISETDRLNKIVSDLLVLSKGEREQIDLDKIDYIDLKNITNTIIEQYKVLNENARFNVEIRENAKLKIKEEHFKQLLIIFIDNAIKYNNKDVINVDIKIEEYKNFVNVIIRDNGIGISKEEIPYIMKRFYKVDKSRVNNNSFGLGLAIAQRLINSYKGSVEIESEEGIFTEFKIIFNI